MSKPKTAISASQNSLSVRPPIVAVLGHVDHGKTSLLDKIRSTGVALREAGGITQKIGAYQIETNGKKITFIDTPGHLAFSAMRQRGAQVCDIAVLVVAANDGVMPQTIESVQHLIASNTPYIIALNKIDLENCDIEKVKKQLADNGILVEGHGGNIVCVSVSAKTGQGISDLLEMILLTYELEEKQASLSDALEAVVIESKLTKAGPAATVIVKNGILKIGDQIIAGGLVSKVRGLVSDKGENLNEAVPGQPVEVTGFLNIPPVGETIRSNSDNGIQMDKIVKKIEIPESAEGKLKVILCADTLGSIEAIKNCLSDNIFVIYSEVGEITESVILSGVTFKAKVAGFNIKCPSSVLKLAESEKVSVKTYNIIYELIEDLEKTAAGNAKDLSGPEVQGQATIIQIFGSDKGRIAGCSVTRGRIHMGDNLVLKRGDNEIGKMKLALMKHQKTDIREATIGDEFGASFTSDLDFKEGDVLVSLKSAPKVP